MIRRGKPTVAWPYFKALRRLFNWAVEEGFIELSPLARTHFKPPSAPPVEPFTLDELKRLLAVCELEMSRRYARGLKAEEAIEAHRNGTSPVEGLGLG
jgi:integrase